MEIPEELRAALRTAKHAVVFSGAGVSAESGIPTFRDAQTGLWARYDPTELATPDAFSRDPALVWGWYEWRRNQVMRSEPNPAHRAIAALASKVPQLTVVTQNVDDLHERAGSRDVVHLHGRLMAPYCADCRAAFMLLLEPPDVPEHGAHMEPPRCSACGGRVRPGVVWFGEALPEDAWALAVRAVRDCDLLFCVGTSALVYPAASLVQLAIAAGVVTVQVNPNQTEMDARVSFNLRGRAGVVLPELFSVL